jgi:predicted RNA binding protein YcfA (HicA-like mRNA interferase family)
MAKREKLLEKIRQNPKNVSFNDLRTLLMQHGFELKLTKGSHHSFKGMIDGQPIYLTVPFNHPLKTVYVKQALELIDRKIAEEESE